MSAHTAPAENSPLLRAVSAARLYSAAELISHAADLCSYSVGLVHDNERRWRTFRQRVGDVLAAGQHAVTG
jgi:hypothetical protein